MRRYAGPVIDGPLQGQLVTREQPVFDTPIKRDLDPIDWIKELHPDVDASTVVITHVTYIWDDDNNHWRVQR